MQIDILLYGNGPWIAIEIEGRQHEEKQYFQTQEEFDYLRECDQIKEWILNNKKVQLVKVYPDCLTKEQFRDLLDRNGIKCSA